MRTLWATQKRMKEKQIYTLDMFFNQCELPDWRDYYDDTPDFRMKHEYTQMCSRGFTCLAHRTESLKKFFNLTDQGMREAFKKDCLTKPITASKVIRITDLADLELFKNDPNFYVIYIVRDPRGLYVSRRKVVKLNRDDTSKLCSKYQTNLNYVKTAEGAWLRNKMLALRYEDLALYPTENVQKIYDFLGTTEGLDVILEKYSGMTGNKNKQDVIANAHGANIQDRYTTTRDSRKTTFKWRWDINSMSDFTKIQDGCGRETFKDLGYQWINSSTELKNIRKLPVGEDYMDRYDSKKYWPLSPFWLFTDGGSAIQTQESPAESSSIISSSSAILAAPVQVSAPAVEAVPSGVEASSSPSGRTKVLIMSEYMGTSKLITEIFNQNEDAVYNFETLYLARTLAQDQAKMEAKQVEILDNYFNRCNYPILEDFYDVTDEFKETEEYYNTCNRGHTCLTRRSISISKLYKYDDNEMPKQFTNLCNSREITSASVIRLEKIKNLEKKFGNDPNFFGIYIFRDPRGLFIDRNDLWVVDGEEIHQLCKIYNDNLNFLASNSPLRQRILPVRYEEVELYPDIFMSKVYDFIKKSGNPGAEKVFQGFRDYFAQAFEGGDRFTKISEEVFDWWNKVTIEQARWVQDACGKDMFRKLGYTLTGTGEGKLLKIRELKYEDDSGMIDEEAVWPMKKKWAFGG